MLQVFISRMPKMCAIPQLISAPLNNIPRLVYLVSITDQWPEKPFEVPQLIKMKEERLRQQRMTFYGNQKISVPSRLNKHAFLILRGNSPSQKRQWNDEANTLRPGFLRKSNFTSGVEFFVLLFIHFLFPSLSNWLRKVELLSSRVCPISDPELDVLKFQACRINRDGLAWRTANIRQLRVTKAHETLPFSICLTLFNKKLLDTFN